MELEDTLYEVLQVSPRASTEVIRAAYRCLAQHHHPDKNAGAEFANDRLARINHAYAVLSDPVKRRSYNQKLGLDSRFVERRGVHAPAPGHCGATAAGHQGARPFGFRPL